MSSWAHTQEAVVTLVTPVIGIRTLADATPKIAQTSTTAAKAVLTTPATAPNLVNAVLGTVTVIRATAVPLLMTTEAVAVPADAFHLLLLTVASWIAAITVAISVSTAAIAILYTPFSVTVVKAASMTANMKAGTKVAILKTTQAKETVSLAAVGNTAAPAWSATCVNRQTHQMC